MAMYPTPDPGVTRVQKICPHCDEIAQVDVPTAGIMAYNAGALVQRAFPTLTPEEREMFMTGWHGACWDKCFAEEDEDHGPMIDEPDTIREHNDRYGKD